MVATVLDRKNKIRVFEQLVGEENELSHQGRESEFLERGVGIGVTSLHSTLHVWYGGRYTPGLTDIY